MTTPETPNKEGIQILAQALASEPELASKLVAVTASKERLAALDMRIAALSEDTTEKVSQLRLAHRAKYGDEFSDIDTKKALIGFPVRHSMKIEGLMSIGLQPPSAKLSRAVEALRLDSAIQNHEAVLLGWVVEVDTTPAGGVKVPLDSLDLTKKLEFLRTVSDLLLARIAATCEDLSAYLSVCLEIDLGN